MSGSSPKLMLVLNV